MLTGYGVEEEWDSSGRSGMGHSYMALRHLLVSAFYHTSLL